MNTQIFSDAMSELNEKYIMEAATFTAKKKSVARIWLSHVACVFLAVVLMGSAVLTFSTEARAAFFGWVRQQYETFYEYFFEGEPEITDPLRYSPGWMPEGCELLTVEETTGGETYIYKDKSGLLAQFYYIYDPDSQKLYIDTVEYISEPVSINGHSGEIYVSIYDDETSSIVWFDNATNTLFYISGPYEKDTLIKMAEGIRIKE